MWKLQFCDPVCVQCNGLIVFFPVQFSALWKGRQLKNQVLFLLFAITLEFPSNFEWGKYSCNSNGFWTDCIGMWNEECVAEEVLGTSSQYKFQYDKLKRITGISLLELPWPRPPSIQILWRERYLLRRENGWRVSRTLTIFIRLLMIQVLYGVVLHN